MTSRDDRPVLRCGFRPSTLDPLARFIDRCEAFVRDLVSLHPGFDGLHFVTPQPKMPPALAHDLSNLRPWLMEHAWDSKNRNRYTGLDATGKPTEATTGSFTLSLSNWQGLDEEFSVDLWTGVVSEPRGYAEARCTIGLPRKAHPELQTGPLPLQLLACVNQHWPLAEADYTLGRLLSAVNRDEPRESWIDTLSIGWLTYVNDPSVAEALPQDIAVQRLGTGIVFQIGERMPGPEDTALVDDMRRVRQALATAGKLGTRHLR